MTDLRNVNDRKWLEESKERTSDRPYKITSE